MRVLVTGDWHLGAVTWRRKPQDRTPEIQACLNEILDFLSQERVDLIAVTGDFTHYWVPLEGRNSVGSWITFMPCLNMHPWLVF